MRIDIVYLIKIYSSRFDINPIFYHLSNKEKTFQEND